MTRFTIAAVAAAIVGLGLTAAPASAQYGIAPGGCYGGNCRTGNCPNGNCATGYCPNGNCYARPVTGYGATSLSASNSPYYSTSYSAPYATNYGSCPNGNCSTGYCPNGNCAAGKCTNCMNGTCAKCANGTCDCPNCLSGNCPKCRAASGYNYYRPASNYNYGYNVQRRY
jgi:hypothetical protein